MLVFLACAQDFKSLHGKSSLFLSKIAEKSADMSVDDQVEQDIVLVGQDT